MRIDTVESGFFKTNTYLVTDDLSGEALLVDPAGNWRRIEELIRAGGSRVVAIVNTHAHYDHASRNVEAKRLTGAPLMIHEAEAERLSSFSWPSLFFRGRPRLSPPADRLLREGDEVEVGGLRFEVLHTPGHSPGGICLRYKKTIFTGDALFAGAIGRTDLKGGDYDTLITAIKDKLFVLSDDIFLYPGHGPRTTIEVERKHNIFVKLRPEQIDEILFGPPRKKRPAADEAEAPQ
ncbi:MAG: MBL fold metallo-hydrolase [Candidatus Lernaella stagnicola]|nr:MBL fold metallo-hydrolase [Candidatus Lernaella stagnicola]